MLILLGLVVENTHVFEDLPVAIAHAVLAVVPLFENLAIRVQLVDDWVRVALLVVREHRDLAKLGDFQQEFSQVRTLVNVDILFEVLGLQKSDNASELSAIFFEF